MPKFLIIWETDRSSWPTDLKERIALRAKSVEMTKQDMKEGKISDWGVFVGGGAGYTVCEGNALDLYKTMQRYLPYYTFDVQEVLSIDEVAEVVKSQME